MSRLTGDAVQPLIGEKRWSVKRRDRLAYPRCTQTFTWRFDALKGA